MKPMSVSRTITTIIASRMPVATVRPM